MKRILLFVMAFLLVWCGACTKEDDVLLGDILKKIAEEQPLTTQEVEQLRLLGNALQMANGITDKINVATGGFYFGIAEFSGDITAHGGDVNANSPSTSVDSRFNLQNSQQTKGALWLDMGTGNIVLQNEVLAQNIVLNTNAGTWSFYDDNTDETVFYGGANNGWHFLATDTNPDYVDGYAILYFYSNAGTDEFRIRGKVGATETQVTVANITP